MVVPATAAPNAKTDKVVVVLLKPILKPNNVFTALKLLQATIRPVTTGVRIVTS